MAKQIREKQFNVQQASKVATEGSAFDDSGVRLAQSLSSLVSDAGQFGDQLSGMYAKGKQTELKQQEKISEDRAYDDLASGLKADPNFLGKYDNIPAGWTDVKWTAYNTMKANSDLVKFSSSLDTARENYLTSVANDPDRSFIQAELDTVYQNTFDQALRTSNGNGSWMQVFLPRATSALQNKATADRAQRSKRMQAAFEEKANNSILGAIANFNFSSVTPEVVQKSNDYYLSQGVADPSSTDIFHYARAGEINKSYQENRQLRKDLGLPVDKDSIVNVFKQLASQEDDLTPVMEILLDMEMPGTGGLTLGESGQRVKLLEVLEDAQEDRSQGIKNSVTVETFDLIDSNKTATRTELEKISKSTKVTSLVTFHNLLRDQNSELDRLEGEILKAEPENKTELLQALNRQRNNNKNLISRGNGVYFADQDNSSQRPRIFKARMLGEMSDEELFAERHNLKAETFEDMLYLQDNLKEGTDVIIREFVKLLGVDPGERTMEEMAFSRLFKPGSAEDAALNSFKEKLFAGGTKKIIEYYNEFDTEAVTIQTKFLSDPDVKELYDNVLKANAIIETTREDNFVLYKEDSTAFFNKVSDPQELAIVYEKLGSDKQREEFSNNLTPEEIKKVQIYLDK